MGKQDRRQSQEPPAVIKFKAQICILTATDTNSLDFLDVRY